MPTWTIVGQWDYTGDPQSSPRDAVRFWCGDTDASDKLVSNVEIEYALSLDSDVRRAAAYVCRYVAARFSREADKSVSAPGGMSVSHSLTQRAASFLKMASELEAVAAATLVKTAVPWCGGISQAQKDSANTDSDRVTTPFTRGQFDFPGTSIQTKEETP